jgi:hypothetical protein
MGKQNERLNGLKMIANKQSYTLKSSNNLADNVVIAINDKNGERSHEKLGSVLYYMDSYSMESDPMLLQLSDFVFAQQTLIEAHKKLTQLVCDNKEFDFNPHIPVLNAVINETNALAEKVKQAVKVLVDKMDDAIVDQPPSIKVSGNRSGEGIVAEVIGLNINETITFPKLLYRPNELTRDVVLDFVKAGRVVVDGVELKFETNNTPTI